MSDGMKALRRVLESIPGCQVSQTSSRHGWLIFFHGRRVGMLARKESDPRSLRNTVQSLRRNGVPIRLVGMQPVADIPGKRPTKASPQGTRERAPLQVDTVTDISEGEQKDM